MREAHQGQTVWEGEVEVFGVQHPKAAECYAWGVEEASKMDCVAVLGIPPVKSAQSAVQAYLVSKARQNKA